MKQASRMSVKGSSASKKSSASKGDPLRCLEEDTLKKKNKVNQLKQKM